MNRIKELRTKKQLTLKEFSSNFNKFTKDNRDNIKSISYATVSRWEKGVNEPKLEMWQALAKYFNVPVSYLQGLGVSKDDIIDDLVEKMIDDKDNFFSKFRLGSELSKKITLSDVRYLNDTFYLKLSNDNVVDKLIDDNNREALRYLVDKYVPFVNDYNFLASVPNNLNDYYKILEDKVFDMTPNPFSNVEIDGKNEDIKIFESLCSLFVLDADTKNKLLNYSDDKKIEINKKVRALFNLLTTDTDDKKVLEIRENVKDQLDAYDNES